MQNDMKKSKGKALHYEKGVTYFSKSFERTVFFVMTLGMLGWGLAEYLLGSLQ